MTIEHLAARINALERKTCCLQENGGASTFVSLTDGPGPFAGNELSSVRVNAAGTSLEYVSLIGGGDALTADPLSQFAATTSAQLAGVISDETGTGVLVFNTSPLFVTPRLAASSTIGHVWTATDVNGNGSFQAASGGMTNPLTTTGDIIYSSSGTTAARRAIGAEGEFLTVQSGLPVWDSINLVVTAVGTGQPVLFDLGTDILYHKAILGSTYVNVATVSNDIVISLPITGTPTGVKYLRDDFSWQTVVAGGDVTKVGTPVDNQVGVWTGNGTIEGTTAWTFDGTTMLINAAAQASTGEVLVKFTVSDDANSYLQIWNSTSAASTFTPLITGHAGASNSQSALTFTAQTTAALDNSTSTPLISFDARRSTGAVLTQRPLFAFKNFTTTYIQMSAGGQLGIGGVTGATEWLQIGAGTTTISPIRLTSGTNLTTARTGAIEYNGTEFFMTATASNRRQVVRSNVATPANGQLAVGNGTDFTLATITEGQNMAITNGAGTITIAGPTLTRGIKIANPTASENAFVFRTPVAITITDTSAVLVGSGSPSVTYNIAFGTDRSSLTNVYTAGQTVTSTTTGTAASGVNDNTIPANSWVVVTTSAQSGTVTELGLSITYTED